MKLFLPLLLLLALLTPGLGGNLRAQQATGSTAKPAEANPAAASADSFAAYAAHLERLMPLVSQCSTGRNAPVCDPAQVGADDEVVLANGEKRMIHYEWLRNLLLKAEKPDPVEPPDAKPAATKAEPAKEQSNPDNPTAHQNESAKDDKDKDDDEEKLPAPGDPKNQSLKPRLPSTTELLKKAAERLTGDLAQARALSAVTMDAHVKEHETLKQVLSSSEYSGLSSPTKAARSRWLEKINSGINKMFEGINQLGAKYPWLGWAALVAFFVLVSATLVWAMIRSERRMRLRLTPEGGFRPAFGAASARDWQLWLADADAAAAAGEWREAIHFLYWASISRLESMRLWPADRARTPREYLALVKADDPRRAGLQQLTRSFERTWYGGRMAVEAEFNAASAVAKELIAAGGSR
jgi:hypothetical protein